jgi:hypothetical protein
MTESSSRLLQQNPDAIANRLINKAEYRDGLQEIAIGVMILTYAALVGTMAAFKGTFGLRVFLLGGLLLMPMGFASQWVIRKVRRRFLAGRVGYVKLKPVNRKKVGIRLGLILGLSCVIAALAAFAMAKVVVAIHRGGGAPLWGLFPPGGWALAGLGIYGGAIMVFRVRSLRYEIGGVIMAAVGILLAFSRVSVVLGLTIFCCYAGFLSLVSGCVVLLHFLRQPTEPAQ